MLKTGVLGWWDGSAAKALTTNPEDSHDGSRNTTSTNYPQNSTCMPVLDFLCYDKALTKVTWEEKGLSYFRACSASHKARAGIWGRNWCRCFGGLLFFVFFSCLVQPVMVPRTTHSEPTSFINWENHHSQAEVVLTFNLNTWEAETSRSPKLQKNPVLTNQTKKERRKKGKERKENVP